MTGLKHSHLHREKQKPASVTLLQDGFARTIIKEEKIEVTAHCSSLLQQIILWTRRAWSRNLSPDLWRSSMIRAFEFGRASLCKRLRLCGTRFHSVALWCSQQTETASKVLTAFYFSTLWYQYASGSIMWSDSGRCTIWTKVHCSICRCTLTMVLQKWRNNAHFTRPLSPVLLYSSRYYQSFSKVVFWVASVFMIPICIQIQGFVDLENLPTFTQSSANSSRSASSLQQRVFPQLLRANFFFSSCSVLPR